MTLKTRLLRRLLLTAAIAAATNVAWTTARAADDDGAGAPAAVPTAPPATAPATQPKVDAATRQLLDQVRDAYAKLKTLEMAGSVSFKADVAGEKQDSTDAFTASFEAPNKFRHEMKDDVVVGCTGEKCFVFHPADKVYVLKDAPKERGPLSDLPRTVSTLLQMQNPSLALAVAKDAAFELLDGSVEVKKLADEKLADKPFDTLVIKNADTEYTFLFDPQTHLLRQARLDERRRIEQGGQSDVKQALVTYDYPATKADAAVKPEQFAWAVPDDGRDIGSAPAARVPGSEDGAMALAGKDAPTFKLAGPDGKEVALADLKGSVVVIDFWATWCGPCVQSLPHLNKLYEDKKGEGLRVLAVSVDEDKAKVPPFVEEKKLTFTVLLDNDEAKVSEKYLVQGIPQTVVVGKDGKVRKVLIGFGPGSAENLAKEVEAALKADK